MAWFLFYPSLEFFVKKKNTVESPRAQKPFCNAWRSDGRQIGAAIALIYDRTVDSQWTQTRPDRAKLRLVRQAQVQKHQHALKYYFTFCAHVFDPWTDVKKSNKA